MLREFFESLSSNFGYRNSARLRSRRSDWLQLRVPGEVQMLESRAMLSAVWSGNAGDQQWNNTGNWVGGKLPTATDAVTINSGSPVNLAGNCYCASLNCTGSLVLDGAHDGALIVSSGGTATVSGGITSNSGYIQGGTINSNIIANGGTLDGVTVNGNIDGTETGNSGFTILNTVAINGVITLGNSSGTNSGYINMGDFSGTASKLTGNATVNLSGSSNNSFNVVAGTATVDTNVKIQGQNAALQSTEGGTLKILGSVSANVAGGTFKLSGNFQYLGSLTAANGGALNLTGTIDNTGLSGGVALSGTLGIHFGTIKNAVVNGGTMTAVNGTLDGTTFNGNIDLSQQDGENIYINNTVTVNGTISLGNSTGTNSGQLLMGPSSGSVSMLTGNANVIFGANESSNQFDVVYGTATIGANVKIHGQSGTMASAENGTFTILGSIISDVSAGTIKLSANSQCLGTLGSANGGSLELDNIIDNTGLTGGFTVSGSVILNFATIKNAIVNGGTIIGEGGTLDNATINGNIDCTPAGGADGSGFTILDVVTVNGTISLGNTAGTTTGYIGMGNFGGSPSTLTGNANVVFGGSGSNSIEVSAGLATIGANVKIHGQNGFVGSSENGTFNILGSIIADVASGNIYLNVASECLGTLGSANGGTFTIQNTINNAGLSGGANGILNLTGPIVLNGAVIKNAIINQGTISSYSGTLDNVLFHGTIAVNGNVVDPAITLLDTVTLNGTIQLGTTSGSTNGGLTLGGNGNPMSLLGNATIVMGANGGNAVTSSNGVTTLGANVLIHGQNGLINGYNGGTFVNNGTISADVASGTINVNSLTNRNVMSAMNGGILNLVDNPFNNAAGTIDIYGASSNVSINVLDGGVVNTFNGGALTGDGGTLDGVTVNGTINLNSSSFTVLNTLTVNGTVLLGATDGSSNGALYFGTGSAGTGTLNGNATVIFGGSNSNSVENDYANDGKGSDGLLTLASSVKIRGQNGRMISSQTGGSIDNKGIITCDVANGTLVLNNSWTNDGTLSASNSGTLNIAGSLTNTATSILTDTSSGTIEYATNLISPVTSTSQFTPSGMTVLNESSSSSSSPQELEAMSKDLGNVPAGFTNNFAFGTLSLSDGTYLKLVDTVHNNVGNSSPEAVYAGTVVIAAGTTLNLNGLHLYCYNLQNNGTVIGSVTVLNNATPTGITLSNNTIGDVEPIGSIVGKFTTTDANPGNTFFYQLSGSGASAFIVDEDGNLRTASTLNAATKSSYSITVTSFDSSGGSFVQNFTITVTTAPQITVKAGTLAITNTTGSFAFASTTVGAPQTQVITVTNSGDATLTVQPVTVPSGFSVVSNFTANQTIAAGASASFTLELNASAAGTPSGAVTIADNDSTASPFTFGVSGSVTTAAAPKMEVTNNSLLLPNNTSTVAFGSTNAGSPVSQVFTVTNVGGGPLIMQPISVPTGFTVVGNFSANQSIAAGSSVSVTIQLTATSNGTDNGVVTLTGSDPTAGTFTFNVTGSVVGPQIAVTNGATTLTNGTSTVAFGNTQMGTPVSEVIKVTNSGQAPLIVQPVTVPSGFSVTNNFTTNQSIAAGSSASFTIQLTATSGGTYSGTVTIGDNDLANSPFKFNVSGSVTSSAPQISVKNGSTVLVNGSSTVALGSVQSGSTASQVITVSNSGTAALIVQPVTVPSGFTVVSNFTTNESIAAGSSASFTIELTATTPASYSGKVTIGDDDTTSSPFTFNVTGTVTAATAPNMSVTSGATSLTNGTSTVAFGTVLTGSTASQVITVTNTGTAPLIVQPITVPTGYTVVGNFSANQSIAAGGNAKLTIELNATTGGSYSGVVTLTDNVAGSSPFKFNVSGTVTAPMISVMNGATSLMNGTSTVAFGTVLTGSTASQVITVTNTGTAPLIVQPITVPTGYTVVGNFSANQSIAAGGNAKLTIELTATTGGSYSGVVTLTDNVAGSSPFKFNVSGTVTAPLISVTNGATSLTNGTSTVAFGTVLTGSTASQVITVTNSGTAPLIVQPITVPSGYTVVGNFSANQSIAAGGNAKLTIELNATTGGSYSGVVTLTDNVAGSSPFKFNVTGTVTAPLISVMNGATSLTTGTSTVAFGTVLTGSTASQVITVTNTGTAPLIVQPITVPSGYTVVGNFSANQSIAAGGNAKLTIELTATAGGSYSGVVTLTDNVAGSSPFKFNVSGTVTSPMISVKNGATSLTNGTSTVAFGTVLTGSTASQVITVTNTGTAPLIVQPITVPTGYTVVGNFSANQSIAAGGNAKLTIELNATTGGSYSGVVTLTDNVAGSSPFKFNVTGTVTAPKLSVTNGTTTLTNGSSAVSLGSVQSGNTTSQVITVTNTGTAPLIVQPITVPAGYTVIGNFTANESIAAGGNAKVTIALTATSPATYSGVVTLTDNVAGSSPFKFNVTGTVTAVAAPKITVTNGSTTLTSGSSTVSLGSVQVGGTATQVITVTNSGNSPLIVQPIKVPAGFTIQNNLTANESIAAGASAKFTVGLSTTNIGTFTGTISISDNVATSSTFTFTVKGTVTAAPAPKIVVKDGSTTLANGSSTISFGSVGYGATATQTITVSNTGTAALIVQPVVVPNGFSVVNNFTANQSIAVGASASFTLKLSAMALGNFNYKISLTDNDTTNSPFNFNVSGTVVAAPRITVKDGSTTLANGTSTVSFGSEQVGSTATQVITVTNSGDAPLVVQPVTVPGAFTVLNNLTANESIAPGASASFKIELPATNAGTYSGTVTINDNDSLNSPFKFNVAGTATPVPAPKIVVKNGSTTLTNGSSTISLGNLAVGATVNEVITVTNSGNAPLIVQPVTVPNGFAIVNNFSANQSIAAGASASFTIKFTALSVGSFNFSLKISDNDPTASQFIFKLSGTVM